MHPTSYREDTRHDLLTCFVRASLTDSALAHFWELRGTKSDERYFDVIRHGISSEPRKMRFGRILWQQLENRVEVEVSFVLVDKSYDDDPENRVSWHGPEEERTRQAAATTEIFLERLLERLVKRSIVSPEEVDIMRQAATREHWQHQKVYFRVEI